MDKHPKKPRKRRPAFYLSTEKRLLVFGHTEVDVVEAYGKAVWERITNTMISTWFMIQGYEITLTPRCRKEHDDARRKDGLID